MKIIMKSSKGLTLIEILIALTIHAIFILMLGGTFYALLSFGNKSQQVLVAREHGRRVIDYVDSRIRNAGLGMWKLESYDAVINALEPLTKSGKPLNNSTKNLRLPVAVTYDYQDGFSDSTLAKADTKTKKDITKKNEDERFIIGNILTLLYAERDTDKREDEDRVNLIIVSKDIQSVDITDFATDGGIFKFLSFGKNHYENSDFVYNTKNTKNDIRNWAVLTGSGVPFYTNSYQFAPSSYGIILWTYANEDTKVYAGDELLYLKCERIFAEDPRDKDKENGETVRNLKVQKLKDTAWGDVTPFESGILEIYMELHKDTNILDFYVLSTGGKDNTMTHDRPKDWPYTARPVESKEGDTEAWNKSKYCNDIVYVSRASWKLNNLCEGFVWD